MSLRAELLGAAVAQRDWVLAELTDDDLAHVARRVWSEFIDKLANKTGEPSAEDLLPVPQLRPVRHAGLSAGPTEIRYVDPKPEMPKPVSPSITELPRPLMQRRG